MASASKRGLAALLVVFGVCASAISFGGKATKENARTPPTGQTGRGSKIMDITPYRIKDEDFWKSSDRGTDKLASALVSEFNGLLVDAPRRITIDKRATFPMGVYHMGPIRALAAAPFKNLGLVAAMDVTNNRLYTASAPAFERDADPIEGRHLDLDALPEGDMCVTTSVELRSGLALPWQPAKYLVSAIVRDQVSNRASVEFCKSASCYVDPEVVKHHAAEVAKINPPAVDPRPGNPLPAYHKRDDSPAVPDQPGIALAAPRLVDLRHGQPWLIQGAYRLAPVPQELVKSGWDDPAFVGHPTETIPTAVITIYLLLTGADDGGVNLWLLRVPSWSKPGAATGYFALDLRKLPGAPSKPQTYFAYAFSGVSMAGPVPMALVGAQ
jgi:hypothetical protein